MISESLTVELKERSAELLADLEAPPSWLDDVVADYNGRAQGAASGDPVTGNPLLVRVVLDRVNLQPVTVPAIRRLVGYYRDLPEFSERAWRDRRGRILGGDLASFHSTLVEIALHDGLSRLRRGTVRFIDPQPGGPRLPDLEIATAGGPIHVELKSIFSEYVRMQGGAGTQLGGMTVDPKIARAIWRKFQEPVQRGQLRDDRQSLVFVDISFCDELFMFQSLAAAMPALRPHAHRLLDSFGSSAPQTAPGHAGLMVCGFDTSSYNLAFVQQVS